MQLWEPLEQLVLTFQKYLSSIATKKPNNHDNVNNNKDGTSKIVFDVATVIKSCKQVDATNFSRQTFLCWWNKLHDEWEFVSSLTGEYVKHLAPPQNKFSFPSYAWELQLPILI